MCALGEQLVFQAIFQIHQFYSDLHGIDEGEYVVLRFKICSLGIIRLISFKSFFFGRQLPLRKIVKTCLYRHETNQT